MPDPRRRDGARTRRLRFAVAALCVLVLLPRPARAIAPLLVVIWVGDYVLGRMVDAVVDPLTGTPTPNQLRRRLEVLENDTALHSQMRDEVRRLRLQIGDRITRAEYKALAEKAVQRMRDVETRLLAAEMLLEKQDVRIADLERGTRGGSPSATAATFIRRGGEFLARKDHTRAVANYCVAIEMSPGDGTPHALLGRAFAARGDFRSAAVCHGRALALAPTAAVYHDRGVARHRLGEYDLALADYREAVTLDPRRALTYYDRGLAWRHLGRPEAAVADFSEAIRLDPAGADAWYQRGAARLDMGRARPAVADLGEAIARAAAKGPAYAMRGRAFLALDEYARAAVDLDEAVRSAPADAGLLADRGRARAMLGRLDEASLDCDRALEIDPNITRAYDARGLVHERKNHPAKAMADFDAAVARDPKYPPPRENRARIHLDSGFPEKAVTELNEVLRLGRANAGALVSRSRAFNRLGRYDLAAADATEAIGVDPAYAPAYFQRGVARAAQGSADSAAADFTEAIRLNPKEAGYYCRRGALRHRAARYEVAIVDYDEAIRLDGRSDHAYLWRGSARRAVGDARCRADFRRALSSKDLECRENAIDALISLDPADAGLLAALPGRASASGKYTGLLRRLHAPHDPGPGVAFRDAGYSFLTSWAGHSGLPRGYWVYVCPYWYLWERKAG